MSATGPDPLLQPLPAAVLPASVQKLLSGAAPAKLMAAKGMAPLRPAELLIAISQLSFDGEAGVRTAAEAAPAVLPEKIVAAALGEALPAETLHFFATRLPVERTAALEKVLYNAACADQTFVDLAARLRARELEIVAQNEARILRCPAILASLFANREAPMSAVNRLIELLVRNGVRAEGIPGFDEVAKAIAGDDSAKDPAADQAFATVLAISEGVAPPDEDREDVEPEDGEPVTKAAVSPRPASSGQIDFSRLKMYEKIRLAMLGNEHCRMHLMRDPNRVVAMAAVRSPRITEAEIVRAAASRQVSEDIIRYIGNQKDFVKAYSVRLALTKNPKCPLAMSLRFLSALTAEDVKGIARSKNVPSALATAARRLATTRAGRNG